MSGFHRWTDLYESILDGDEMNIDEVIKLAGWRVHQVPLSMGRPAIILAALYGRDHIEKRLLDDLLQYQGPISRQLRHNVLKHVMSRVRPLPPNCFLRCNLKKMMDGLLDLKLFDDNIWFFLQDTRALYIWTDYFRSNYDYIKVQIEIRNLVVQSYRRGLRAVLAMEWAVQTELFELAVAEIPDLHRAVFTGDVQLVRDMLPIQRDWMTATFEFPRTEYDRRGRAAAEINDNFIAGPITALQLAVLTDDTIILGILCDYADTIPENLAQDLITLAAKSGSPACMQLLLDRNFLDNAYHKRWSTIVQTALKRQNFDIALTILKSLTPPFDAEFYYFWRFFENVSGFKQAGEEVIVEVWRNHDVYKPLHKDRTSISPAKMEDRSMFAISAARPELVQQCHQIYGEPKFKTQAFNYYNLITQTATESVVLVEICSEKFPHNSWDAERILQSISPKNVPVLRLILDDRLMTKNLYPQKILDICLPNEASFSLALELMDWLDIESFLKFARNPLKRVPKYFQQLSTYTQLILRSSLRNGIKIDLRDESIIQNATQEDLEHFQRVLVSTGLEIDDSLWQVLVRSRMGLPPVGDGNRRKKVPPRRGGHSPLPLRTLAMHAYKHILGVQRPQTLQNLSRLAVRRAVRHTASIISLHDTLILLNRTRNIQESMINMLMFKKGSYNDMFYIL